MDSTVTLIVMAIVSSLGYGLYNFFIKSTPGTFEPKRLIVTVVFAVVIALIAVYMQIPVENMTWETLAGLYVVYAGLLVYVNQAVDKVWLLKFGSKLGGEVKP